MTDRLMTQDKGKDLDLCSFADFLQDGKVFILLEREAGGKLDVKFHENGKHISPVFARNIYSYVFHWTGIFFFSSLSAFLSFFVTFHDNVRYLKYPRQQSVHMY